MQSLKRKPRLALFVPTMSGGGAERVMVDLAHGFFAKGVDFDMVLIRKEGPYINQLPSGINLVDLQAKHTSSGLFALSRYLRRFSPEVVLSAMNYANVVILLAKRLARVKTRIVVSEHNPFSFWIKDPPNLRTRLMLRGLMRITYLKADAIVTVSRGVADDLVNSIGVPREKIKVIYNPIRLDDILAKAKEPMDHPWFRSEEPVILSVGRLHPHKDYPTLLRAFSLVRNKIKARLLILGEGEERPRLISLTRKLNIAENVDMPGFVENPYKYMASSEVFVLSSKAEGLPNVLLEAIACGCPVVATDCPSGPREILEVTGVGRLVPVGDPESMAKAILEAMEKREENEPNLRPFLLENVVKQYMEVCGL